MMQTFTISPHLGADTVFALAQHVAVEHFDDKSLLLDLHSRGMIEFNTYESWVVGQLNGQSTLSQIAKDYAATFATAREEASVIVQITCERLAKDHVLRLVRGAWEGVAMETARYIQNPDVNLREEDDDGALIFDPNTGRVMLLNSTGYFIWNQCKTGSTIAEIVAAFKAKFEDVPETDVIADVDEFINQMVESGFIGELVSS